MKGKDVRRRQVSLAASFARSIQVITDIEMGRRNAALTVSYKDLDSGCPSFLRLCPPE